MIRRVLRRTPVAALCAAAIVSACAKGDKSADSARVADSAAASATAAPPPAPAAPTLTDPNILAILDAANAADSSAGFVAATKGTNGEVRSFAKDMMRDHHALRKQGQDLAKKLNVTPELPAGDNSQAAATAWHDSLSAMPKGAAFDKAYIDHEVTTHRAVLETAQTALGATQNADLKALIQKAAPNIQAHLEHAQSIQTKLNAPPAASGKAAGASGATDTTGVPKKP